MSRANTHITLNIKGRDWIFMLLSDRAFDKLHNADGGSSAAMTMPNQYLVHFRKSDWCLEDIIHELGHVLKHMSETHTTDLTPEQMEELMCQLMAKNYFEVGVWASRIAECFFGRK